MTKALHIFSIFVFFALPYMLASQILLPDITPDDLRNRFNQDINQPRILTVLGAQCGACVSHKNNLRDFIYSQCDNPNLKFYIVWVPAWGEAKSVAESEAATVSDSRLIQLWNPANDIPYTFSNASWTSCNYAWDISYLYDAGIEWTETDPPVPSYCMAKANCCNPYNINTLKSELERLNICAPVISVEESIYDYENLVIYPNPGSGRYTISVDLQKRGNFSICIIDILGREVYSEIIKNSFGKMDKVINLEGHPKGIYFLQINTNEKLIIRKFWIL